MSDIDNENSQGSENPQGPVIPQSSVAQTDNTKLYSILAYIGILFVVGLIADPNNHKVRFHINQGIVLFIFEIVVSIVLSVFAFIPFLGLLFLFISWIAWIAYLALAITGIVNVTKDEQKPLPIIGGITILK